METKPNESINTIEYNNNYISTGLTKREYFAAMALQGMLAKYGSDYQVQTAKEAVYFADALIEELNKTKQDA
jgi:hypothetical protein